MKRILAFLCALACLCSMLCVPAMAAEDETVTVYAYVPMGWADVYLYVWTGSGGEGQYPVAWPGAPMNDEGDGWYSAEIPSDMTMAIVNNNSGSQTGDLEILSGIDQWITVAGDLSAEVYYEEPSADDLPSGEVTMPEGDFTIHVTVPDSWDTAYVWAWDESQKNVYDAWPGEKLSKDDDGYYTVSLPVWANYLVIAEKDGGAQTVDLSVSDKEQWIVVGEANDEGKYNASVSESDPNGEYEDITIHAMVPADWTDVRLWAWNGNTNLAVEAWPGELVMTQDAEGWYTIQVAGWVSGVLVSASAGTLKTADITIEGTEIWIDATTDLENPVVTTEKPVVDLPEEPEPTEPEATEPEATEPEVTEPEATEPPATEAPTEPAATEAPTEAAPIDSGAASGSSFDPTILIVIAVVLVVGAAVAGEILLAKKKK